MAARPRPVCAPLSLAHWRAGGGALLHYRHWRLLAELGSPRAILGHFHVRVAGYPSAFRLTARPHLSCTRCVQRPHVLAICVRACGAAAAAAVCPLVPYPAAVACSHAAATAADPGCGAHAGR